LFSAPCELPVLWRRFGNIDGVNFAIRLRRQFGELLLVGFVKSFLDHGASYYAPFKHAVLLY